MARWLKGLLTGILSTGLVPLGAWLYYLVAGSVLPAHPHGFTGLLALSAAPVIGGLIFGLAYGLMAGILVIYDLGAVTGWLALILDATWSLPNTVLGFLVGNLVYPFFGAPSRAQSENQSWIVYMPRGSSGFGHSVLQTLGTVNLGGAGQHERMHLLQARIFGPLYLPIFGANYIVTFALQLLWTGTAGLLLWLTHLRDTPYFRPPSRSAVSGFFGWIYYATIFELWAYAAGNP